MKNKEKYEEDKGVPGSCCSDCNLNLNQAGEEEEVCYLVQSPNVFPFRRKLSLLSQFKISSVNYTNFPQILLLFNVILLMDWGGGGLCSAQVVDLGYGRTTSTINPNNQSLISKYYTNQQVRDLRDYPDQDINWLSPNPFANRGDQQSFNNNSIHQQQQSQYDRDLMNRNRVQLPYQNPNSRLPGYNLEDLKPEHRGETGDPSDPNYRPQQTQTVGAGGIGDEQYDGFGRNIPVSGGVGPIRIGGGGSVTGGFPSPPIDTYTSRERERDRGHLGATNTDWSNINQRQYPQSYFNTSRSGSMSLPPGLQGPPNTNNNPYTNNPYNTNNNLPPSSDISSGGRSISSSPAWNNIPGYPSVGPSSNFPGSPGVHYYPNGTRISEPQNSNYPGGNYNSNNYPGASYPGAADNPYYPGQQQNYNQNNNQRAYENTWRNSYQGGAGGGTFDNRYDAGFSGNRPNRPPIGPVNYPGRVTFNPGDPHVNIWSEQWSTTTYRPTAPGVLGRWRPDLQGQQRPEDINQVPQAVYVTTNYGRIQGFKVKIYDGPWVPPPARPGIANVDKVKSVVSSFYGIPYARAPINEGRFRPPRSHPGWQLHQAVEFGPACPQPARFFGFSQGIVQVDEDCLYLNVHSPDVGSGVEGSPFPVLFYIHDGDFIHGASNQFPPHQLVAWYKVVVVTVNFRLGALGFLSTADEFSPGNYGMLDLSKALQWTYENIRSFNGDPERITLVGLGSGAGAAGLLMLAPRTRAMVKNVVALEGAPTADWAAIIDYYRAQNTTQLYSFKMGCWQEYETTSWKMVQCLRSRSWQELANLELDPDVGTFPWAPVVDRTFKTPKDDYLHDWKEEDWRFLPDTPYNLLRHGEYPYIKYMTGFSRQSAADLLYNNKTLAPNFVVTRDWFDEQIHLWVKKYNYTLNIDGVFRAIRYAYTYWPDPYNTTHLREEYIDFLSDALYRSPVDQTVKLLLARGIPVHSYFLNYTLEGLRLPFWREVPRGMEYYLLSGAPFMDPEFYPERLRVERSAWTEGDRNMSNFFMTAVANLAHYGQPTPREVLGIHWEASLPSDLRYLALNGTNNSTMQRNYRQREVTFWTEYMPFVVGRDVPTYPPTTEYWWEPNEPMQVAFWTVSGVCLILIVALVACCLLWRTAKKQRDRIYDDLGLGSEHLGLGTIVGDEISEYADTVKTTDSMDSGVKLTSQHPEGGRIEGGRSRIQPIYSPHPAIHHYNGNTREGGIGSGSGASLPLRGDRFPTPIKRSMRDREGRDTPQTQV